MKKNNEYNHVGRPTNEEIMKKKKKKNLKIISIISIILFVVGGVILYLNKDSLELSSVMGNSSINTVVFNPNSVSSSNTSLYYYSNNNNFVLTLYEKAGFNRELFSRLYERKGIKVYNSNKKYLATIKEGKIFYVNKKYSGQTLILQMFARNITNGKYVKKYVKLKIDKNNLYKVSIKSMLTYANTLVNKDFKSLKTTFASYETNSFNGDWCSWFVWNIYYKYGFVKKNSWKNSLGDSSKDEDLSYAFGWTTFSEYHGYVRGKLKNKNDLSYIPQPGDLILFKWDSTDNSVDHVGIVKSVNSNYIEVIEGNVDGYGLNYYKNSKVKVKKRALVNKKYIGKTYYYENSNKGKGEIVGYFSPKKYF